MAPNLLNGDRWADARAGDEEECLRGLNRAECGQRWEWDRA